MFSVNGRVFLSKNYDTVEDSHGTIMNSVQVKLRLSERWGRGKNMVKSLLIVPQQETWALLVCVRGRCGIGCGEVRMVVMVFLLYVYHIFVLCVQKVTRKSPDYSELQADVPSADDFMTNGQRKPKYLQYICNYLSCVLQFYIFSRIIHDLHNCC